ncbi:MAG: RagB/SusD family nutrient uptake outer membrane protein, partial [Segetibacter sp.]|nr:RagB/SusD family nutrient uptake outer membrane protein [Segetibacter sp.]
EYLTTNIKIMNNKMIKKLLITGAAVVSLVSCTKDLDRFPTNDITSATVYSTPAGYKQALAKVYGAFALTGNQGPAGAGDIQGIDEGFSDFFRLYWNVQELPTDEAVIAWNDATIQNFHAMNWGSSDPFLQGLYYRSMYQVTLANEFVKQSAPERVSERGISGNDAINIATYAAEARFIRAYQYANLMDLFGNPPFATENNAFGSIPTQIQRKDLFNYVESELKALEGILPAPRANEYGRADKAAAWALLARIYLNAQVYTGTARYADAVTYSKKVIDAGYSLIADYRHLMLADNNLNTSEFILTINYDGLNTQGYGGTTYLVHASTGGSMDPIKQGIPSGGWFGLRTTKNLPALFPDVNGTADKRAQFHTSGQNLEINDLGNFNDGYAVTKYRNVTRTGAPAPHLNPSGEFVDIDMPIFRLAEMYLIYAEATVRGGGGEAGLALQYINALRTRAYGNATGNIASAQLTADFILDERGRELYWEGFRRTDLIRYGRFTTGAYIWPWKGGVKTGRAVEDYRNVYPLPASDVTANPNLKQNTGY